MAILIQVTCLMFLFGVVYSWPFPLIFERRIPITYVKTSVEEGPAAPSSLFDRMNQIMAGMHERFEHMFSWPSYPVDIYNNDYDFTDDENQFNLGNDFMNNENQFHVVDDLTDIKKKLDAVQPVCTTISDSSTTISPRKSRRKKLPTTQTTTCIKELIVNGQKHFSEEITTTDEKGVVIKHSQSYGAVSVDTASNQQMINSYYQD